MKKWMGVAAATVVRALDGWSKSTTFYHHIHSAPIRTTRTLGTNHSSSLATLMWDGCYSKSLRIPTSNTARNKNMVLRSKSQSFLQSRSSSSTPAFFSTTTTTTNVRSFWLRFRGGAAAEMVDDVRGTTAAGRTNNGSGSPSMSSSTTTTATTTKTTSQQSSSASSLQRHNNNNNNNYDPSFFSYETSVCSVQGMRHAMEDECFLSNRGDFAAVFDGHGGPAVSKYIRQNLFAHLQAALPTTNTDQVNTTTTSIRPTFRSYSVEDFVKALELAIAKVDQEVQRIAHWSFQGSTVVAVWLHQETIPPEYNNENNNNNSTTPTLTTILAANVGDSRAVLSRNGVAIELTKDHKPEDPDEWARIEAAGGKVVWCDESELYRINGNMALSRAVGDRSERPYVTADPDITVTPMNVEQDEFIVVASDGLWDVISSEEVVDLIHYLLLQVDPDIIADLVTEEALLRGTTDNVTVVIIFLKSRHRP